MELIKRPLAKHFHSGNISVTPQEWKDLICRKYTIILVIRDKETTKRYQYEEWMTDRAQQVISSGGETVMLIPVSKGSPLYRKHI